jgi:hypothetical protein
MTIAPVTDAEELLDVLRRRAVAHHRDDAQLEHLTRLGDFLRRQIRQAQQVDDAWPDLRAGRRGHEGPAAGADLDGDHSVRLQPTEGFPDGHPTDAELFAEDPFSRQPVAGLELTVPDQDSDLVDDHLRGPAG